MATFLNPSCGASAAPFAVTDGVINGNNVQFTQRYEPSSAGGAESTVWRAIVVEVDGTPQMLKGQWSGSSMTGTFEAARRSNRSHLAALAGSRAVAESGGGGEDRAAARAVQERLQHAEQVGPLRPSAAHTAVDFGLLACRGMLSLSHSPSWS